MKKFISIIIILSFIGCNIDNSESRSNIDKTTNDNSSTNGDRCDHIIDIPNETYVMPIGVPTPWIAPDVASPDRPTSWETEQTGYYFIDFSVGTDSNNIFGTPLSPRKTIPNPIPAGSYVVVKGNYNYVQGSIKINGAGTGEPWIAGVSGPAWVVGESAENRAEITGKKLLISGSYVYLENFYFHSGGKIQFGSFVSGNQADHILVRNSELKGETDVTGGILIHPVGIEGEPASNILIFNNKAHSIGPLNSQTDIDARGLAIGKYTDNIWILNNMFYDSSAGLQVEAGNGTHQSTTHHIYIGHNHVCNVAQAGIGVKYALDIIISENKIHNIIDTPWSPSKGIGFQYAPDRVWIMFNKISNTNIGIRGGSDNGDTIRESVYIIGNLIENISIGGISNYGATEGVGIEINNGGSPRYIINNTVVNCDVALGNGYYNSTMIIENNVISQSKYQDIRFIGGNLTGQLSILNNSYFDDEAKIIWGDGVTRNLSDIQNRFGKGQSCISGGSLFNNASSGDFTLKPTSPAVGRGLKPQDLAVNVYELFNSLYGIDINFNINRTSLPNNDPINMGAY